jgi:hypothetical protein
VIGPANSAQAAVGDAAQTTLKLEDWLKTPQKSALGQGLKITTGWSMVTEFDLGTAWCGRTWGFRKILLEYFLRRSALHP